MQQSTDPHIAPPGMGRRFAREAPACLNQRGRTAARASGHRFAHHWLGPFLSQPRLQSSGTRGAPFLLRSSCTLVLVLLLMGLTSGCERHSGLIEIQGHTMGTSYSIKLVELPEGMNAEELKEAIDTRLEQINEVMSTYRATSAISRFNADHSTDWIEAHPELVALVERARLISEWSGGAFDVTVGPLVDLWGFGPRLEAPGIPDDSLIGATRARIGYDKVATREDPPALRKARRDVEIDLSAIAKGYGVDQVAALLDDMGSRAYLAEIGGELRARGRKSADQPWRVAIERPTAGVRAVHRVLALEDAAMATSGDYRNFFEHEGQWYSHTIDPKTGHPVTHTLASVTVIAKDCATADALATAFLVMGPVDGYQLADSAGVAALFVTRENGQYRDLATHAFSLASGDDSVDQTLNSPRLPLPPQADL